MFFNWGHFFTIGGIFFKVGGKKLFWDRENQIFWELYGPLYLTDKQRPSYQCVL